MKTKQGPAQSGRPSKPSKKPRGKLRFEDGVRAALVASAVICAAVLGAGGFFAVRSALDGGSDLSAVADSAAEDTAGTESAGTEGTESGAETAGQNPAGTELPGLEEALRDLGGSGGTADTESAAPASPSAPPAAPPGPAAPSGANPAGGPDGSRGRGPAPGSKGTLVLVIDDAGNNLRELEPFLAFPGPLTIAVLPGLPHSVEAARRVRAANNKELFLHQPMEPLGGQNPGPGAITTGMGPAEVRDIFVKNLNEIGPVAGFNNHEGSRATGDPAIMRPLLEISRSGALAFLDSRTTADTAAPAVARELGIAIAQRDIFLDNEQDRESILAALEAGCVKAEQNGRAILIGHVWSPRLAAILAEMYPRLLGRGFSFTTVTGLLGRGK
ncbi:MAG: divergent polysaccharide deacetylase family protein [Treponema sp.]|jgi:polysaccharide deacetylase 2 family uncharacterized protein YibQ|nr:divergent polysaccharide deacetylase family protein [Treponema sp.]